MPQTIPIKQLIQNEINFYPLTAANGVFFSDGTFLSSKTFISSATYNSTSKKIEFYEGSTKKFELDATAFIKDGMIDSVSIGNGAASGPNAGVSCLLIDFNTDSGKTDIEIPLSQIFDPSNYLTATQIQNGYVAKETGKGLSTNDYTTTEKNKLAGIAAGAEVNVQANWTETNSSSDAYIQNKPTLATVATSGSYADLSNKPTIPDVSNMVSTTDTLTSDKIILGNDNKYVKSSSKTIATTLGSDDTTVPTSKAVRDALPTVNNATLTIQKNGTTVDTFTANASSNKTVNITVPTKTSDLTNDSGFLGESEERVISAALNDLNSRINTADNRIDDCLTNDDGEVISTALNDLNLRTTGNSSDIEALQSIVATVPQYYQLDGNTYYPNNGYVSMTSYPSWGNVQSKPTIRTSIRAASSASNTDLVSEKAVASALASAGQVDNVTLNGVSATINNKTAALPLSVSSTGDGNVVTGVSLSSNSTTINVTKGSIDMSSKEDTANKLTSGSLSSYSTNTTKFPSAKIVYDAVSVKEDSSNKVTSLSASSTDTQYPSAKAVYDALENKLGEEDEEVISASLNDLNTRLEDVEDTLVFDTTPTGNSGNLVTSGAVYQAIATMTNKKQLITYTTSDTYVENLAWDTVHKFPEMASLEFTIATEPNDGYSHEITIIFDSGSTATTLDYPSNVLWGRNVVLVPEANYRYEINIDDSNIAVFTEAALSNT